MGLECPNLRQLAKYRITWDESRRGRTQDPWLMQIPGRLGHVYPFGPQVLAVWTDRDQRIRGRLLAVGCRMWQDGDCEATFTFPVSLLPRVGRIVGLYRRPRLTAAQHRDRILRGRLGSGCVRGKSGRKSGPESTIRG